MAHLDSARGPRSTSPLVPLPEGSGRTLRGRSPAGPLPCAGLGTGGPQAVTGRATRCNTALTRRTYRQLMDTVAKAAPTRTGPGIAAANLLSRAVRRDPSPEHGCSLPGYLQLPDLAMFWQCVDCGETWQVVADWAGARLAPGVRLGKGSDPSPRVTGAIGDTTA